MKKWLIAALSFIIFNQVCFSNGDRGGGNVVFCNKKGISRVIEYNKGYPVRATDFASGHYYSLDYALTRDIQNYYWRGEEYKAFGFLPSQKKLKGIKPKNCYEYLKIIGKQIAKRSPEYSASFNTFVEEGKEWTLLNDRDSSEKFLSFDSKSNNKWGYCEGINCVPKLEDLQLKGYVLSAACDKKRITQFVHRSYLDGIARYLINQQVALNDIDVTQCSYAMVHEWARNYLKNSKNIYLVSAYLHSVSFHNDKGPSLELSALLTFEDIEPCHQKSIERINIKLVNEFSKVSNMLIKLDRAD